MSSGVTFRGGTHSSPSFVASPLSSLSVHDDTEPALIPRTLKSQRNWEEGA